MTTHNNTLNGNDVFLYYDILEDVLSQQLNLLNIANVDVDAANNLNISSQQRKKPKKIKELPDNFIGFKYLAIGASYLERLTIFFDLKLVKKFARNKTIESKFQEVEIDCKEVGNECYTINSDDEEYDSDDEENNERPYIVDEDFYPDFDQQLEIPEDDYQPSYYKIINDKYIEDKNIRFSLNFLEPLFITDYHHLYQSKIEAYDDELNQLNLLKHYFYKKGVVLWRFRKGEWMDYPEKLRQLKRFVLCDRHKMELLTANTLDNPTAFQQEISKACPQLPPSIIKHILIPYLDEEFHTLYIHYDGESG